MRVRSNGTPTLLRGRWSEPPESRPSLLSALRGVLRFLSSLSVRRCMYRLGTAVEGSRELLSMPRKCARDGASCSLPSSVPLGRAPPPFSVDGPGTPTPLQDVGWPAMGDRRSLGPPRSATPDRRSSACRAGRWIVGIGVGMKGGVFIVLDGRVVGLRGTILIKTFQLRRDQIIAREWLNR